MSPETDRIADEAEPNEDVEAARAEEQILTAARDARPETFAALRKVVDELPLESSLLEATLWSLINDRTIQLNPDRTITVAG